MVLKEIKDFDPGVSGKPLLDIMEKFNQAKYIYQCHVAGVFDCLTLEPEFPETVAKNPGFLAPRLIAVLDALASIDLVQKTNGKYALTPISYTYLCSRSPFYSGDLLAFNLLHDVSFNADGLKSWLLGITDAQEHNPQKLFSQSFVRAMAQGVLIDNTVYKTTELISRQPCFETAKNVLDVGGGHGLFSIALKKVRANINATVFDLPTNAPVTREYAENCGESIDFAPGDFYRDELPSNQDVVLCFDILYPVSTEMKELVMGKVYRALNKGGHLFYKLWVLDDDGVESEQLAFFALHLKTHNMDSHVHTLTEATDMLKNQGFEIEDVLSWGEKAPKIIVAVKK